MSVEAMAHWRRLDCEGTDRCRLLRVDGGWMLAGQALWRRDGVAAELDYAIRCDAAWRCLSADVTGHIGPRQIGARIVPAGAGWSLNGAVQAGCDGLGDVDLGFTPASNLIPLRRLRLSGPTDAAAALLVDDCTRLERLDQRYDPVASGEMDYAAPGVGYHDRLTVDPSGFVTRYPGLWEGWVDG